MPLNAGVVQIKYEIIRGSWDSVYAEARRQAATDPNAACWLVFVFDIIRGFNHH